MEALEGRYLPSASPLVSPPELLVPGHEALSPERVNRAIRAVDAQLLTPDLQPGTQHWISIDLDQDGSPDLIGWLHPPGGSRDVLTVVFGASDRHPAFEAHMALGHTVSRILVADFDGDGRLDVFAQEGNSGAGTLLLGRPDDLFDATRKGGGHSSFAVADLDGVGKTDFVYANDQSARIEVDLASGPHLYAGVEGQLAPTDVQLADLAGTGKPDLAVSQGDGSIKVYADVGGGNFSAQQREMPDLFAGTGPVHVAFAHLESPTSGPGKSKDSPLDMVIASTACGKVAVLFGQERGGYQLGQLMSVGLAPSSVSVRDVNGDGIPDLVVTCAGDNSVWILRGLGRGRFDDAHPLILPTGQEPVGAYTGDFTGDGKTDLVTLDRGSNGLTYYKNLGGSFAPPQHIDSGGTGPTAAVVRDVNGDGTSDLIVANRDDGRVTLFYGSPAGLHAEQTIERVGSHPSALAVGPGTQPGNQVFVLYENEDHAEVLTFTPLRGDATPGVEAEAPALDSPSEVRIVLHRVGGGSIDVVPTLLVELPEIDEAPAGGVQKPATNPEHGSGGIEGKAKEAAPVDESSGSSSEVVSQRYLLGVDDVPPPSLEPAGAISSLAPPGRTVSEVPRPSDEPTMSMTHSTEAIPVEEAERADSVEEMTSKEAEAIAYSDLLFGVLLIVGSTTRWADLPPNRRDQFVARSR